MASLTVSHQDIRCPPSNQEYKPELQETFMNKARTINETQHYEEINIPDTFNCTNPTFM